ncbi:MAG: M50 family metallopeptidase [Bacillota bacterium]|nr:M50 family metallopeptidase [Bacillota bacterium]
MIIAILFTVFIHEAGHALGIMLTRAGRIQGLVLNLKGIGISWEPYANEPLKRTFVSLAGPAINLLFAISFFITGQELLFLTNLVFGLVNLLPLPGSDGSRVLTNLKHVFQQLQAIS